MYKIIKDPTGMLMSIFNSMTSGFIPFISDNVDYVKFKADILAGKQLQDADGKTLSQTEAEAFIATLP